MKYVAVKLHDAPGKPYDKQEMLGSGNTLFGSYSRVKNFLRYRLEPVAKEGDTYNLYTYIAWKQDQKPFMQYVVGELWLH